MSVCTWSSLVTIKCFLALIIANRAHPLIGNGGCMPDMMLCLACTAGLDLIETGPGVTCIGTSDCIKRGPVSSWLKY